MIRNSIVLVAFLASGAQALANVPQLALCKVSGPKVVEPENGSLESLLIDSSSPRVLAIALREVDSKAKAVFVTYANLRVRLSKKGDLRLQTEVQSNFGKPLAITEDDNNPLHNTIRFGSRAGGEDVAVDVTCTPYASSYVFLPRRSFKGKPTSGSHYLPTTVTNILSNAGRENFAIKKDEGAAEYLASNYCIAGSAEAAIADMERVQDASLGLWRTNPMNPSVSLVPIKFGRDSAGSISWDQPIVQAKCVASRIETNYDDETGIPRRQTVCDREIEVELSPKTLEIPVCR